MNPLFLGLAAVSSVMGMFAPNVSGKRHYGHGLYDIEHRPSGKDRREIQKRRNANVARIRAAKH